MRAVWASNKADLTARRGWVPPPPPYPPPPPWGRSVLPEGSNQMAPAGTQEVKWGEDTGAVREPSPAAGRAPEKGRQEARGIRVWAEASSGALGRLVTLAGPKETSRFRASTKEQKERKQNFSISSRQAYPSQGCPASNC
ncbi:uncharacterized protein [Macaca nemestrina]|uniref:uncharacterized protein isoform X1 n=1 Tax=Macaca nemestrina TaxID=9545 RepID=UPI0039B8C59C